MTTTNYNIRLDQDLKDRSFSVLESYGLTPSQAIRLFLNQVADTNAIPLSFDYQQPKLNARKHLLLLQRSRAVTALSTIALVI